MPRTPALTRSALLLLLAASSPLAAALPAGPGLIATVVPPVLLPVWCSGPASAGCVLDVSGPGWTLNPDDGARLLGETFLLEFRGTGPQEQRPFTFSLPLAGDRRRVRIAPGDPVFFNAPAPPAGAQLFTCGPIPGGRPGTVLAECAPLSSVGDVPSGGVAENAVMGRPGPAFLPRSGKGVA